MVDATKEMILECDDIELVKVTVPMWKDKDGNCLDVYIKQFCADDAQEYMSGADETGRVSESQNIKAIAVSVCDSNGNRLFNKKDVDKLAKKNLQVLNWLANEIVRINFSAVEPIDKQVKNS